MTHEKGSETTYLMKRILGSQILKANLILPEFLFFFFFIFSFPFFLCYSFANFRTWRVMSFGGLLQFYIRLNSPSSRIRKIKGVLPVYMFSKIIYVEMFQLGKYRMIITSRVLDGSSEECFNRQEDIDPHFFVSVMTAFLMSDICFKLVMKNSIFDSMKIN